MARYQNELPYDSPRQSPWTQPDGTLGYPGYKLADDVTGHTLQPLAGACAAQSDALMALVDTLEVERVPVVGMSGGGPAAYWLAGL